MGKPCDLSNGMKVEQKPEQWPYVWYKSDGTRDTINTKITQKKAYRIKMEENYRHFFFQGRKKGPN